MKRTLIKAAFVALLVVVPIRVVLALFPDEPFWHFRELLDSPGSIVQGVMIAVLITDDYDPDKYIAGLDRIINFIWLYIAVFLIAALAIRIFSTEEPSRYRSRF